MVEQLIRNQQVGSSNLLAGSILSSKNGIASIHARVVVRCVPWRPICEEVAIRQPARSLDACARISMVKRTDDLTPEEYRDCQRLRGSSGAAGPRSRVAHALAEAGPLRSQFGGPYPWSAPLFGILAWAYLGVYLGTMAMTNRARVCES